MAASGGQRILFFGDAITCPHQLHHPSWHSVGDVDVKLANHSREWIWNELSKPGTDGVGSHFPQAQEGTLALHEGRAWSA